jgi:CPSF A subunit region
VVLYSTINGSIGAFLPFATKDDVDFFTNLEMYMRQVIINITYIAMSVLACSHNLSL